VRLHKETSDTYVSSDVPCPSDIIGSLAELIALVTVVPLGANPLWADHTVSINILHMHSTEIPFHRTCVCLHRTWAPFTVDVLL
jgi:hypothetical protein